MSPAEAAELVEVHMATDNDVAIAVEQALGASGFSFEELADQARAGRFQSDKARRAWFLVTAVGRAA